MNWSSFKYLARQGLHSMVKNRLMSVASIGVLIGSIGTASSIRKYLRV